MVSGRVREWKSAMAGPPPHKSEAARRASQAGFIPLTQSSPGARTVVPIRHGSHVFDVAAVPRRRLTGSRHCRRPPRLDSELSLPEARSSWNRGLQIGPFGSSCSTTSSQTCSPKWGSSWESRQSNSSRPSMAGSAGWQPTLTRRLATQLHSSEPTRRSIHFSRETPSVRWPSIRGIHRHRGSHSPCAVSEGESSNSGFK